jgi:hypothetical protein
MGDVTHLDIHYVYMHNYNYESKNPKQINLEQME